MWMVHFLYYPPRLLSTVVHNRIERIQFLNIFRGWRLVVDKLYCDLFRYCCIWPFLFIVDWIRENARKNKMKKKASNDEFYWSAISVSSVKLTLLFFIFLNNKYLPVVYYWYGSVELAWVGLLWLVVKFNEPWNMLLEINC